MLKEKNQETSSTTINSEDFSKMKYTIKNGSIVEISTNLILYSVRNFPLGRRRKLLKQLNDGAGFDGWTPSFMAISQSTTER